jgi:hypothetical protein
MGVIVRLAVGKDVDRMHIMVVPSEITAGIPLFLPPLMEQNTSRSGPPWWLPN